MIESGYTILDGTVSVVVPVRDEEPNIRPFCSRIKNVLEQVASDWEVIFIEDSSTDDTVQLIQEIGLADPRFCAIFLTRSFGHHEAFTAGIEHARGEHIIMMDGDLQHPPEFIPELVRVYVQGYDMVYAERKGKESFVKNLGSITINALMRLLSDAPIDLNTSIFRIFSRQVADTLISMREHGRFITGMLSWPGFKMRAVPFTESPRESGKTKYGFRRLVNLSWYAITSFSVKPLRIGIYMGFLSSFMSLFAVLYYIVKYILYDVPVAGFTAIIVAIFFMGGMILFVLGIIGEYLGNVFMEVKDRPLYVVYRTFNIKTECRPDFQTLL